MRSSRGALDELERQQRLGTRDGVAYAEHVVDQLTEAARSGAGEGRAEAPWASNPEAMAAYAGER